MSFTNDNFPNFELKSDELYPEDPGRKFSNDEIVMKIEDESVGCCRMKFFCL